MARDDAHAARPRIAFVGAGPTALYTLHALVRRAARPVEVTVFEQQAVAGQGTPYRPGWNDPAMLANIASVELPPLEDSLVGWLREQSAERLAALGLARDGLDERAFYPRVVLGAFFRAQFEAVVARAQRDGHDVQVRTRTRVVDVVHDAGAVTLVVQPARGAEVRERFEHLVLATGHQWPEDPEASPGYFLSPWPASRLAQLPPCRVGIRGSSLTAIDATVALATKHGAFVEGGERLAYVPAPGTEPFHVTMMSRKGLLPEADFFHVLPYEPLAHCTAEAVDRLAEGPADGLLDRVFALFARELAAADPAYAAERGLADLTVETFGERYFARRREVDAFVWAEENLREAKDGYAREHTVPWRYAILRMHEVVERIVPYLDDRDFERFWRHFKPVFVDDYATVPHASIERLLALHDAGKLALVALGDDYRVDSRLAEGGAAVLVGRERRHFPVFVEAMGQPSLPASEFPFPTLVAQGIVRDEPTRAPGTPARGIAVDERFHPVVDGAPIAPLFCVALPFLLGRHPFLQGITSSHTIGEVVGQALSEATAR